MSEIDVERCGGLENALKKLKSGIIEVSAGSLLGPLKIRDRSVGDAKKHRYFLSRGEKRRKKHQEAMSRLRRRRFRQERAQTRFQFRQRGVRVSQEQEQIGEAAAVVGSTKKSTALILIMKKLMGAEKYLVLQDKEKGKMGFPTGGIEPGETLAQTVRRESQEETNLFPIVPENIEVFFENNVAKRWETPYLMKGVLVTKVTGRIKAGEEIVIGSIRWCTASEINDLIKEGKIIYNHSIMWLKFCELREKGALNV